MNKRSQVTIFIILAILIIGAVALFFTLKGTLQREEVYALEVAPIKNFVQGCLDDSLEDVVYRIGEGGGYYYLVRVASTPLLEVPYYIKNNKNLIPSKEQIEDEISRYVARDLVLCPGDFEDFPEYEITKGKILAETTIEEERVLVDVSYPIYVKKGGFSTEIKDFETEIPLRLGVVHSSIGKFIKQESEKEIEGICLSCLLNITSENNLHATFFNYDNKTSIFIIEDPNSKINDKEFIYVFANEY